MNSSPDLIDIPLVGMAHGGNAVGRHEGRAIFVSYGIPGEIARVHITEDKGRFATAEIVEIIEYSTDRIQPRCAHFRQCGGCHWQHIAYDAQLVLKRQIVQEQLSRIGGIRDAIVYPTIASPNPWQYRSHSTFHVTTDNKLGFIGTDNHSIIPIGECHIIRPELLEVVNGGLSEENQAKRVRLQVGSEGQPLIFPMISDDLPFANASHDAVFYSIHGKRFQCSSGSFFQVNLPQAEILIDKVLEYLDLKGDENVLELYSGVGMFTAFLGKRAKNVTAVEISPSAVQDAVVNLAEFDNITLIEGKIESVLKWLGRGKWDVVVLDPPRSGIESKALHGVVWRSPATIVYVSCDVATLARDAKKLREEGYQLLSVQPVDMFPQTYHIECIAHFRR